MGLLSENPFDRVSPREDPQNRCGAVVHSGFAQRAAPLVRCSPPSGQVPPFRSSRQLASPMLPDPPSAREMSKSRRADPGPWGGPVAR